MIDEYEKKEIVLYYGLNEKQQLLMNSLLETLRVKGQPLSEADLCLSIGYLAGIPGCDLCSAGSDYRKPDSTFAILHNMDDDRIREFLNALKKTNEFKIDLKAVITEHNKTWNCIDLIAELKREHEVMQAYMSTRNALNAARQLYETIINNDENIDQYRSVLSEFESIIAKAAAVIHKGEKGGELDLDMLIGTRQSLAGIMQRITLMQAELAE